MAESDKPKEQQHLPLKVSFDEPFSIDSTGLVFKKDKHGSSSRAEREIQLPNGKIVEVVITKENDLSELDKKVIIPEGSIQGQFSLQSGKKGLVIRYDNAPCTFGMSTTAPEEEGVPNVTFGLSIREQNFIFSNGRGGDIAHNDEVLYYSAEAAICMETGEEGSVIISEASLPEVQYVLTERPMDIVPE
jgi:hypothetical protein